MASTVLIALGALLIVTGLASIVRSMRRKLKDPPEPDTPDTGQ